ncbi:hypothetical protein [Metabacillus sp. RGM 3146]|uniref:hypothetical protein n=1 Tax=Metabacillus sp. RGM 3146 TaxID=3401092 RepID=UPI003B9C8F31
MKKKMPFAPYINWVVLAFFAFVIVVLGFSSDTRIALVFTPIWFVMLVIAYRIIKRTASNRLWNFS